MFCVLKTLSAGLVSGQSEKPGKSTQKLSLTSAQVLVVLGGCVSVMTGAIVAADQVGTFCVYARVRVVSAFVDV